MIKIMFKKVNSLTGHGSNKLNTGKFVNIIANSMNAIENKFYTLFYLCLSPISLITSIIYLWIYSGFGVISLVGIGTLVLAYPLQSFLGKRNQKLIRMKNMIIDDRLRMAGEAIENARLIKMYVWENAFIKFL